MRPPTVKMGHWREGAGWAERLQNRIRWRKRWSVGTARKTAKPEPGKVYVGPAGWSYADWEGIVYPPGRGDRLVAVGTRAVGGG